MLRSRPCHRRWPRLAVAAVPALLVVPFTAVGGTGIAGAAPAAAAAAASFVCTGTVGAPGFIPGGTYSTVTVNGPCAVNDGPVIVTGDITLTGSPTASNTSAALNATFAQNDHLQTPSGTSGLKVDGNILVGKNATLFLGCGSQDSMCSDDPNLASPGFVGESIIATDALGVVVENSHIVGDALQIGGGGGAFPGQGPGGGCAGVGVFAPGPAFSDYEDNTIGGNLSYTGLKSCWFGSLRNKVGGSISVLGNTMADSDATEFLTNQIRGNLICVGNNPGAQYGDSHGMPNIVSGYGAGECAFSVKTPDPSPGGPLTPIAVPAVQSPGYDLGATDGGLFTFGPAFFGSAAGTEPGPYVGPSTAPGGLGYYLGDAIGILQMYGPNAKFFGDPNGLPLAKPIVATAAAPGGDGYWEVGGDGGVFAFGPGAPFEGSAGGVRLAQPIVGMAAAPTGNGYDLVATDGGVFTYGPGAHFHGSLGNVHLNGPIVGMAIDPSTGGYWLVGSDGGVFSFNAPFFGSLGAIHLDSPIVGIAAAPTGNGYYLVGGDGGVFTFGPGAHFHGSLGNVHLNAPISGIALG